VLSAVEIVTTLDNDYWLALGEPDGPERVQAGTLRPNWTKRGFLRGYTDARYTFGRYFSPVAPNRPRTVERLLADNDVVLYDRRADPDERINLALDPGNRDLIADLLTKLESLIDTEIGADERAWVTERPRLVGWPTWRGDAA
jgi:arylsulfatase